MPLSCPEPVWTHNRIDAKEAIRRLELKEAVALAVGDAFKELAVLLGSRLKELEESPSPARVRQLRDDVQTWLLTR